MESSAFAFVCIGNKASQLFVIFRHGWRVAICDFAKILTDRPRTENVFDIWYISRESFNLVRPQDLIK